MGDIENHFKMYQRFKADAENDRLFEGTRAEAYFLAAYHLIEACAAKERVHINKHQRVRQILEDNRFILGKGTEVVWRAFQTIENQLRPKFSYGFSWSAKDIDEVIEHFRTIESTCLEVMGR